jgi:ribonuclease-3
VSESAPSPETRPELVERVLGHRFTNLDLLLQACTHTSRIGPNAEPAERRRKANERLEFLGDALLGAAVAQALFRRQPEADEGWLSRAKSTIVSRQVLARSGERLGLWPHCLVGAHVGQQWPDSVKANLVEAVLGAIHLDGGWDALVRAVERVMAEALDDPASAETDPRMALQVWAHEQGLGLPAYATERSGGSDHAPEFTSTVTSGSFTATATGLSRKRAEAAAASLVLAQVRSAPPVP